MTINKPTASLILLFALGISSVESLAQDAFTRKTPPHFPKDRAELDKFCEAGQQATLPRLGGNYDAILDLHFPSGDIPGGLNGTGELRIVNNLMRNDADLHYAFIHKSLAKSSVWTDLATDESIEWRRVIKQGDTLTHTESFLDNLSKVPVTKCGVVPYDKDKDRQVTIYRIDHKAITTGNAFDGLVAFDQYGRLASVRGAEKNITPEKCGAYKSMSMDVTAFGSTLDPNDPAMHPRKLEDNPTEKTEAPVDNAHLEKNIENKANKRTLNEPKPKGSKVCTVAP